MRIVPMSEIEANRSLNYDEYSALIGPPPAFKAPWESPEDYLFPTNDGNVFAVAEIPSPQKVDWGYMESLLHADLSSDELLASDPPIDPAYFWWFAAHTNIDAHRLYMAYFDTVLIPQTTSHRDHTGELYRVNGLKKLFEFASRMIFREVEADWGWGGSDDQEHGLWLTKAAEGRCLKADDIWQLIGLKFHANDDRLAYSDPRKTQLGGTCPFDYQLVEYFASGEWADTSILEHAEVVVNDKMTWVLLLKDDQWLPISYFEEGNLDKELQTYRASQELLGFRPVFDLDQPARGIKAFPPLDILTMPKQVAWRDDDFRQFSNFSSNRGDMCVRKRPKEDIYLSRDLIYLPLHCSSVRLVAKIDGDASTGHRDIFLFLPIQRYMKISREYRDTYWIDRINSKDALKPLVFEVTTTTTTTTKYDPWAHFYRKAAENAAKKGNSDIVASIQANAAKHAASTSSSTTTSTSTSSTTTTRTTEPSMTDILRTSESSVPVTETTDEPIPIKPIRRVQIAKIIGATLGTLGVAALGTTGILLLVSTDRSDRRRRLLSTTPTTPSHMFQEAIKTIRERFPGSAASPDVVFITAHPPEVWGVPEREDEVEDATKAETDQANALQIDEGGIEGPVEA